MGAGAENWNPDAPASEATKRARAERLRISTLEHATRTVETNALGQRANYPASFPEFLVLELVDLYKAEYLDAVASWNLRVYDTWKFWNELQRSDPQMHEEVREAAMLLSHCALVHTSWYLPFRNALGSILRYSTGPIVQKCLSNPTFSDWTTEAYIAIDCTQNFLTAEMVFVVKRLRNLKVLDFDARHWKIFDDRSATSFLRIINYLPDRNTKLEELAVRLGGIALKHLLKLVEIPHPSLKSLTIEVPQVGMYFLQRVAPTIAHAALSHGIMQPFHVQSDVLEHIHIISPSPAPMPVPALLPFSKFAYRRTSPESRIFKFDEVVSIAAEIPVFAGIQLGMADVCSDLFASLPSLVIDCCELYRHGMEDVRNMIQESRILTHLHIRIRIPDSLPFDALIALSSSVEKLSISLANDADKRELEDWDEKIFAGLEKVALGGLKNLHVCVATSFKIAYLPRCERWCAEKEVDFIATCGGRNLYL